LVQDMPRIRQNTIEEFRFHIIDETQVKSSQVAFNTQVTIAPVLQK